MGTPVDDRHVGATRLGSYEILRKLARGGMAEIFLARAVGPEGFEKLVVLKKILPQFAANPKFVKLFLDEARLAAGFDHPHIAHVYDMGTVDGHYFFTMEYVHGQDVRSVLRRTDKSNRQLPIDHAVQIARNVAAALHYAHERRRPDGTLLDIVHRDVSPSNMVVSYDGAVKLLDFGVAKAASSSVKTRTGTLKGKIAYMSPEQARGATIDRRSDIFSLGIVLWELVATRRLFKADNDLATIQLIINTEAPPVSVVRQDCPPELEQIIARALAQDVGERYQTAQELQVELEELARENKLNQSSIALSRYMQEMFSAEIEAWRDAQSSGITLTDHVIGGGAGASVSELTTPVSAADIEDLSGEGPAAEDEDDLPGIVLDGDKTARRPTAIPQELPKITAPMRPAAFKAAPELVPAPVSGPSSIAPTVPVPVATPLATVMPPRPVPQSVPPPVTSPSTPGLPATSLSGLSSPSVASGNGSIGWSTGAQPSLSGSVPGLPRRSRVPAILLATIGVIAVGVGIGTIIARHGAAKAPAKVVEPAAEPAAEPATSALPPPPPPSDPAPEPATAPPAPAPVPAAVPDPAPTPPAVSADPPTPTVTPAPTVTPTPAPASATAKRHAKPKPKPAAPVKKPPKFDPNAALPPE